jgi:hypothetical protein
MALFILLLSGPSAMGRLVLPVSLRLGGWIATVVMMLAAVGLNVSWIVSRVPEGPRPPSFASPTHQPFSQAPKPSQVAVRTNGFEGCVRSRVVVVLDYENRLLFAA